MRRVAVSEKGAGRRAGHDEGGQVSAAAEATLRRAWESSQRSTKEDWDEWMRNFAVELLHHSSSPALRATWILAQVSPSPSLPFPAPFPPLPSPFPPPLPLDRLAWGSCTPCTAPCALRCCAACLELLFRFRVVCPRLLLVPASPGSGSPLPGLHFWNPEEGPSAADPTTPKLAAIDNKFVQIGHAASSVKAQLLNSATVSCARV